MSMKSSINDAFSGGVALVVGSYEAPRSVPGRVSMCASREGGRLNDTVRLAVRQPHEVPDAPLVGLLPYTFVIRKLLAQLHVLCRRHGRVRLARASHVDFAHPSTLHDLLHIFLADAPARHHFDLAR